MHVCFFVRAQGNQSVGLICWVLSCAASLAPTRGVRAASPFQRFVPVLGCVPCRQGTTITAASSSACQLAGSKATLLLLLLQTLPASVPSPPLMRWLKCKKQSAGQGEKAPQFSMTMMVRCTPVSDQQCVPSALINEALC
jgi:hypothetical protein